METVEFKDLDDGDEFKYDGRLYEKDSVPPSMEGILENAMCLEDFTAANFKQDDEVIPA